MPKTNAEYCRDYRKKKRQNKIRKTPKSSTERVREFRARRKALLNDGGNDNDDLNVQNSEIDHIHQNVKEVQQNMQEDIPKLTPRAVNYQSDNVYSDGDWDDDLPYKQNTDTSKSAESEITLNDGTGHNVLCKECQEQIIGYVCVECVDWDLCGGCEPRAAHSQHYVLRLPGPSPQTKVKSLITAIQEQLKSIFDVAQTMEPYNKHCMKLEYDLMIKEEPLDIHDYSVVPQLLESKVITILPERKVTQNAINEMRDIFAHTVSPIAMGQQEVTIKEEPMPSERIFVPETTSATPTHDNDPLTEQSSSIIVYSTHKPANRRIKYK